MAKVHSRIKRHIGLSTHLKHYNYFHVTVKKRRPKTFKTENAAHAWASKHGLKKEEFSLKLAKHNKKFQIVTHHGKN